MRFRMLVLSLSLLVADSARADVVARLVTPGFSPGVGSNFDVAIRATLGQPTLGWGLDLAFDPAILQLSGAPTLGPDWIGFATPDGDGLGGVALGAGLTGSDVLLATLHFEALSLGTSNLALSATPSDLTEGFALDPMGFDANAVFQDAQVVVVPEPDSGLLGLGGLLVLAAARRRREAAQSRASSRSETTRR